MVVFTVMFTVPVCADVRAIGVRACVCVCVYVCV